MLTYNEIVDYVERHMKQGDVYVEINDITHLTDETIDKLGVGDVIVKLTGAQKHGYMVTYKKDKHGICLTYVDASCAETVSYDYSGGHWVYNSKDVTIFADLGDKIEMNPELVGTEPLMTGIEVNGNKYKAPESSQLYVHKIRLFVNTNRFNIKIISTDPEPYTQNNYISKINLAQLDEVIEGCSTVWAYNTSAGTYTQISIYSNGPNLRIINSSGQAETVSPTFSGDDVSVLGLVRLN